MYKNDININLDDLPKEIRAIAGVLESAGKKAYLVGGCLRDLLLGRVPKDWDIATDAHPEEIQELFPDSVYENEFGTVGIKTRTKTGQDTDGTGQATDIIEITTFRKDSGYSDSRHPDKVTFAKTIEEDLARRDFTINAIAFRLTPNTEHLTLNKESRESSQGSPASTRPLVGRGGSVRGQVLLIDPYGGIKDIENKLIRAVGEPKERFEEDALRLLRAVRLEVQLGISDGWKIESKTEEAIKEASLNLSKIAKERIRDEFVKIIMEHDAAIGIRRLEELNLLEHIIPELREGIGMGQNKHHIYTVFEHNVRALEYASHKNYSFDVRLSSLLHDVGKPRSKRGEGTNSTFYGHQVVGERMSKKILERLKFPSNVVRRVSLLVREHMFMYDPDVVTMAGVRRLVARVGGENMEDLLKLREADRIGSGVPKAKTYRLRHLEAMIEKAKTEPIGPKMLKIGGDELISELGIKPGPKLGNIIYVLLEMALEEPDINNKEALMKKAEELNKLDEGELEKMAKEAKESANKAQERIDKEIKEKYFVE